MYKTYALVSLTALSLLLVQCKTIDTNRLQNVQNLGPNGNVHLFIYDTSTTPPRIVVEECNERALVLPGAEINDGCPENQRKAFVNLTYENFEQMMTKASRQFPQELSAKGLSSDKFLTFYMDNYLKAGATEPKKLLFTVSTAEQKSDQDKLLSKVLTTILHDGLQDQLSLSFKILRFDISPNDSKKLRILTCKYDNYNPVCTPELAGYSGVKTISFSHLKPTVPADFFFEFMRRLRQGPIVSDGTIYNETLYSPQQWQAANPVDIKFINALNDNLQKIEESQFTSGWEVIYVTPRDKYDSTPPYFVTYECERVNRDSGRCEKRERQNAVIPESRYKDWLYYAIGECNKRARTTCFPGNTLDLIAKNLTAQKKPASYSDVIDELFIFWKSYLKFKDRLLIGRARVVPSTDTSKYKALFFMETIYFNMFSPGNKQKEEPVVDANIQ